MRGRRSFGEGLLFFIGQSMRLRAKIMNSKVKIAK